ncbi:hypothetical protein H311_00327 [Anncaliia algerae PRA109]|nr:hypothetical protein H311_00327 [Anncaliia algerae PRA109]
MSYDEIENIFSQRNKHEKNISMLKNIFFNKTNLKINKILQTCYLCIHKCPTIEIVEMIAIQRESVTAWCSQLRKLLSDSLEYSEIEIGGPDIIVEIDETKLDKRKYNRGHVIEGVWVVEGIVRLHEGKSFYVCNVNIFTIIFI